MKRWLLKQKFIVDTGFQILPLVNFTLLIVAVSDRLLKITGIGRVWVLLVVTVSVAFLGIWLVGYMLDRFGYNQGLQEEQLQRSPTWAKSVVYFERILAELRSKDVPK